MVHNCARLHGQRHGVRTLKHNVLALRVHSQVAGERTLMALELRPVEIERVRDEERLFGGDIVWWVLLLVISVPIMLWGLSQIPDTGGFVFLGIGGVGAGIAFAQIALRLPYLTHRFLLSIVIATLVVVVIGVVALIFSTTLSVPTAPVDVMYKPPISGG